MWMPEVFIISISTGVFILLAWLMAVHVYYSLFSFFPLFVMSLNIFFCIIIPMITCQVLFRSGDTIAIGCLVVWNVVNMK